MLQFEKLEDGVYVVLDMTYAVMCVGYDPRVANQSLSPAAQEPQIVAGEE